MKKPRMSLKRGKHRIWIGSAGKKKEKFWEMRRGVSDVSGSLVGLIFASC